MPFKSLFQRRQRSGWRYYQSGLQRGANVRRFWRRLVFRATAGTLLALIAVVGLPAIWRNAGGLIRSIATHRPPSTPASEPISKRNVGELLGENAFSALAGKRVELPVNGNVLQVETTLDDDLQRYLLDRIDRQHSRYVGIVVMDAETGRVLAMPGYDRTDPSGNPCLDSHFPAASIFKIVTAASAVDQCGYTADSPMRFCGNKHTLYKRQLTNATDRYTTTISFRDAFAQSVNPVFGKLGGLELRKPVLEKSADAFGFNEPLDFELPLPPSRFQIGDEPYHWAEVGSGFNRDTTISPLHGAMIASAVLNAGRMVAPSIVERIVDAQGQILYTWQSGPAQQAMSPRAASVLSQMMETTVTKGTGRRAFRKFRNDRILSRLQIGGKTGSIDSASHDVHYDWFVGFARERLGQRRIVVAAVVAHEKYIGTRAGEYARMAISHYFGKLSGEGSVAANRLRKRTAASDPGRQSPAPERS